MLPDNRNLSTLSPGILFIMLLFLTPCIHSQIENPEWVTDTMFFGDKNLAYHLFIPENYDNTHSYPLIVHLHGANHTIETKLNQLPKFRGPADYISTAVQSENPCFVLLPISPTKTNVWVEFDEPGYWGDTPVLADQNTYQPLIELIDSMGSTYNIDMNRIYLDGHSAGGVGAWAYMGENPEYFAAAIILMGHSMINTENQINSITHIPVWNHHGEMDNLQPVILSRIIFQNYEHRGFPVVYPELQKYVKPEIPMNLKQNIITDEIDIIYSEYERYAHNVWNLAYNDPILYDWLFSKRKRTRGIISFMEDKGDKKLGNDHTFKINCEVDTLQMALDYSSDLGYSWDSVGRYPSSMNSIQFSTIPLEDSPQGQFRLQLLDKNGSIIGTDYSAYYKVDNEQNCIPWLKHYISAIVYNGDHNASNIDHVKVMLNANDAENDSLDLDVFLSRDKSSGYHLIQTGKIEASRMDQPVIINFDTIVAERATRVKFILSDGENTVKDSTKYFNDIKFEETFLWVWQDSIKVEVNDSAYIDYILYPLFEQDRIKSIVSENEDIASIRNYIVKGITPGQTTIYFSAEADDGYFVDSCIIIVQNPAEIITSQNTANIRLFPNPTSDILNIHLDRKDKIELKIISIKGQLLYSTSLREDCNQLDLSYLQKGIYFISISSKDFLITRKIIKL